MQERRRRAAGMKESTRKFYYVNGGGLGWYIIRANNKQEAKSHGVHEFGRGGVQSVDLATDAEVKSYMAQKGIKSVEEIDEA
jgi:hypothetical protein